MYSIKLNNVSKTYKNGTVGLKNTNLDIERGKVTLVVGENGAGKSTLINLLINMINPTTGTIEYNVDVLEGSELSKIGFATQDLLIDWYLTVFDNVILGGLLAGKPLKECKVKALELLKKFNLEKYKDQGVESLSGGEQQKVMIARALINDPNIIILDEPTAGVDIEQSLDLLEYIREQSLKNGKTIIITTHQLNQIRNYVDNIIFIKSGEVIINDTISNFMKMFCDYDRIIVETDATVNREIIENTKDVIVKNMFPLEIIAPKDFDVLKILYDNNIQVSSVKKEELSLEDVYLKIAKEKK